MKQGWEVECQGEIGRWCGSWQNQIKNVNWLHQCITQSSNCSKYFLAFLRTSRSSLLFFFSLATQLSTITIATTITATRAVRPRAGCTRSNTPVIPSGQKINASLTPSPLMSPMMTLDGREGQGRPISAESETNEYKSVDQTIYFAFKCTENWGIGTDVRDEIAYVNVTL